MVVFLLFLNLKQKHQDQCLHNCTISFPMYCNTVWSLFTADGQKKSKTLQRRLAQYRICNQQCSINAWRTEVGIAGVQKNQTSADNVLQDHQQPHWHKPGTIFLPRTVQNLIKSLSTVWTDLYKNKQLSVSIILFFTPTNNSSLEYFTIVCSSQLGILQAGSQFSFFSGWSKLVTKVGLRMATAVLVRVFLFITLGTATVTGLV